MFSENPTNQSKDLTEKKVLTDSEKQKLKEDLMRDIETIEGEMDNVMDRADKCKLELTSIAATVEQEEVKENLQNKISNLDEILKELSKLHKNMSEKVAELSE